MITAASCEEALALIRQSAAKPDVIISDLGMPTDDGFDLIGKVRALSPEDGGLIPAIAVTGYANPDDRRRALAAGFQRHLAKPIDPTAIAIAVGEVAAGKPR